MLYTCHNCSMLKFSRVMRYEYVHINSSKKCSNSLKIANAETMNLKVLSVSSLQCTNNVVLQFFPQFFQAPTTNTPLPSPSADNDKECDHNAMQEFPQQIISHHTTDGKSGNRRYALLNLHAICYKLIFLYSVHK